MSWPKRGSTHNHTQLGLPNEGGATKGLVVCYGLDLGLLKRSDHPTFVTNHPPWGIIHMDRLFIGIFSNFNIIMHLDAVANW